MSFTGQREPIISSVASDSASTRQSLRVSYVGHKQATSLLGSRGEAVLSKVLELIKSSAQSMGWPLAKVEVRYTRDPEVKDWEYVLLVLVFDCPFDIADKHLHELYGHLDNLTHSLNADEQRALRRLLFFDIETTASISSA